MVYTALYSRLYGLPVTQDPGGMMIKWNFGPILRQMNSALQYLEFRWKKNINLADFILI